MLCAFLKQLTFLNWYSNLFFMSWRVRLTKISSRCRCEVETTCGEAGTWKVGHASHSSHFIGVPAGFLVYVNSYVHNVKLKKIV